MSWLITVCEACWDDEHGDCRGDGCECSRGPCADRRLAEEATP